MSSYIELVNLSGDTFKREYVIQDEAETLFNWYIDSGAYQEVTLKHKGEGYGLVYSKALGKVFECWIN